MSWFKIDDSFHAHPKVKSIPRKDRGPAIGLWTMAGSWSSQQLTDGFVPQYMLDEFGVPARFASVLVAARLWIVNDDPAGWRFHDWHAHQPSREVIQAKRKQNTERIAAWRAAKTAPSNTVTPELHDESEFVTDEYAEEHVTQPPTRPDPTRPDPIGKEQKTSPAKRGHRLPDDWQPSRALVENARTRWPSVDLRDETEAFCDWFHAKAGRDATKVDWGLAWQGWMRRTHKKNTENDRPTKAATDRFRMLG